MDRSSDGDVVSIRKAKKRMDQLTRFHDRFPDAAGSWAFERAFHKWAVKRQYGGIRAYQEQIEAAFSESSDEGLLIAEEAWGAQCEVAARNEWTEE